MKKLLLFALLAFAWRSVYAQSAGLTVVTVGSGATPTLTTTAGFTTFVWTLSGNVTSSTFSSAAVGAGSLVLCENSTGGYTVVFPTNFKNFTALQNTAANYCQYYTWEYDGTNVTSVGSTNNPGSVTGTGFTVYDVYYQGSSGLALAEANGSTTVPGICIASSTTVCLYSGTVTNGSWSWTEGGILYVSDSTAGLLTQTAPSTSGHYVQIMGVATSATSILVMPSLNVAGIQ